MMRKLSAGRIAIFCGFVLCSAAAWAAVATGPAKFSRPAIDIGITCSDVEASKKFYVDALGFKPAGGFDVPAAMATDIGLADNKTWRIDVFKLGDDPQAAAIKLMEFKDLSPAKVDKSFLHSSLGVGYLTLNVPDIDAAVARAAEAGVKPIAKGVVEIPASIAAGIFIVVFRDPDGNLIELVGPRGK
ncbi:MAG TPA: VOC family protein [Pirellulales bacterium]